MTRRSFATLRQRMSEPAQAASKAKTQAMLADMLLSEIRQQAGLTQTNLANELGISQPGLSQLENQDDMQISTLKRIITALGGSLEIVAHLPHGDIRINQFSDTQPTH